MAKIRKSFVGALLCAMILLIGVCALTFTACGSKELTVTFSIEGKEQTVEVVDGEVNFPADPVKEYYEFRGWYTTETFEDGTEFTKDTEVKQNITVYAYFVPIYVDITLNGGVSEEIKLADLSSKTTEYTADAESKNLTFDGWYIDSNYGTAYSTQDTDNLYARYVATVTFDNGYETVYTEKVAINTPASKPAENEIVKYYMSGEDIFYVGEDGQEIDFSKNITANMTITVKWKTPKLAYTVNQSTGKLSVTGFESGVVIGTNATFGNYPALSFPGKVTYEGKLTDVEAVVISSNLVDISYACRTILINEGIKYVSGLNGAGACKVAQVNLPSSLRILDAAFNNLPAVGSVTIPEGLEVLIASFNGCGTDIQIAVPDSVTDLALAPKNLVFSETSAFRNDGNAIYKSEGGNEKAVLINQFDYEGGVLTVAEGVEKIKVGALWKEAVGDGLQYIYLPSSFKEVICNAADDNYPYYITNVNRSYSLVDSITQSTGMYAIVDNLHELTRVVINTTALPEGVSENAICGIADGTIFGPLKPYTDGVFAAEDKVVFVGEIAEGEAVQVTVRATHRVSGDVTKAEVHNVTSGSELTERQVLSAVGLYDSNKMVVLSVTQFGREYVYGTVTCNQYISILYEDANGGYTYTASDGEIVITGYNEETAIDDGNNLFKVVIPSEIDGFAVTSIAEGAFKGNTAISTVVIPASVKTIGAEAFMNATNLATVDIAAGGLEVIGRSAFENFAAVEMAVPLANMKDIQPYAFKSRTLKKFLIAEGETNNATGLCMKDGAFSQMMLQGAELVTPSVGSFLFMENTNGEYYQILKYMGSTTEAVKKGTATEETMDITVNDVQLVAVAGGTGNWALVLGYSMRYYATYGGMFEECGEYPVIRYEIMEGSVYYLDNVVSNTSTWGIRFGIISKVHKNAFTDMNAKFTEIKTAANGEKSVISYIREVNQEAFCDTWLTISDFSDTTVFEDGWWEGLMQSDADYAEKMEWVQYLKKDTSGSLSG